MSPEVKRVLSNYVRLLITFIVGVVIVRFLIDAGPEYFGFYSLITIGFGVGIMGKELIRIALVPRLGKTIAISNRAYSRSLSSALVISTSIGLFSSGVLLLVMMNIHRFSLPTMIYEQAQLFLLFRAVQVFFSVSLAPFPITFLVSRKYVLSNCYLTFERLVELASVVLAIQCVEYSDGLLLVVVGFTAMVGNTIIVFGSVMWVLRTTDDLAISLKFISKFEIKTLIAFFGLTALLVLSSNLFLRFDIAYINLKSGVLATVIFGVAVQAIGMLHQLTNGLVSGLDAAFAFSKSQESSDHSVLRLMWISSYLQSSLAFAAYGAVVFCGRELLLLWLGAEKLETQVIRETHLLINLMGLGMIVRGIAEVWINALNGMGNIRLYVWWLFPGAVSNPILFVILLYWFGDLQAYWIAGSLFTGLQILTYGIAIPLVLARNLEISIFNLYHPFLVPFATVSIVASLIWIIRPSNGYDPMQLLATVVAFVMVTITCLLILWRNGARD